MAAKIRNPWTNSRKSDAEKAAGNVDRLQADIAHAERVLAWQIAEGYEPQAEYSRQLIAKLQSKLAKLN